LKKHSTGPSVFNLDGYTKIYIPMLLTLFPWTILPCEVFSLSTFVQMRHIVSRCTWNEAARMLSNLCSIVRKAKIIELEHHIAGFYAGELVATS
jgi:hypothetical protein